MASDGWSAGRGDDPVLADLAVDRRPRHSQRFGCLGLVAVGVQQGLHDGVALHRLQRAEQAAAHRPALGWQVTRMDSSAALVVHDLLEHLPELLGVARPAGPEQKLHRLGGAGKLPWGFSLATKNGTSSCRSSMWWR